MFIELLLCSTVTAESLCLLEQNQSLVLLILGRLLGGTPASSAKLRAD
jgi:hypothetical protein